MRGNHHQRRARKAIGAGCAAAMATTTMLFVGSPAPAEPGETIVTEIAPSEDPGNYAGWHQGYENAEYTYGLTADGLMMSGKSQVINGYENNDNDLSTGDNVALRRTLRLATYELDSGQAWFQVALFFDNTPENDTDPPKFTTLRPAAPGTAGRNEIDMRVMWQTSGAINEEYPKNATAPLGELLEQIGQDRKTIGFGVLTTADTEAVVESIDWDDETYRFRAPKATKQIVADGDIDLDEFRYDGWHQGAVNDGVPGKHRVTEQGLELDGRSQVIKGYDNSTEDVDSRNVHLPSAVQNASYNVVEGTTVHFQIPLFFTAPGQDGVGFTTLRPADPAKKGNNKLSSVDNWVASRAIGTVPAGTPMPFGDLIDAMTDYKVLGFGVYNDSGEATVKNITFDGVRYRFHDAAKVKKERVFFNDIAGSETDETYKQWHQGANNGTEENPDWGKYEVTNEGLSLEGRSQVINGDRKANDVSLKHALRDASYNVVDGDAWFQVALFINSDEEDDPTAPVFTTLRPAEPAETEKNEISMQDEWVSSRDFGEVRANEPMPLGDLVNAVGSDYDVLAFGVFSDTSGSAMVDEITWGGTTYRFVNRAPKAQNKNVKTKARKARTVRLPKRDRDGNLVTYDFDKPVNGKLKADGRIMTYTPNRNFTGRDRVRYTASDPYGKSDTGHVTVRVRKLNARVVKAVVRPKHLTPKKRARLHIRVRSGGKAAMGRVLVREGRKVLGVRRLNKFGAQTVWLGRLDRGKHNLTVRYAGNKISKKAVKKVTVRVPRR